MKSHHFINYMFSMLAMLFLPQLSLALQFNEDAAKSAEYDCPIPSTESGIRVKAEQLHLNSHSKNDLGCAADLLYALANRQKKNFDTQLTAIEYHYDYMQHVNALSAFDIARIAEGEWLARLEKAATQFNEIRQRAANLKPNDPKFLILTAITSVESRGLIRYTKDDIQAIQRAISQLKEAIQKKPNALNAVALKALGRWHYDLPAISGGNMQKAREYLEKAYRLDPGNIELLRYLVEVYDQELEENKARKMLSRITKAPQPSKEKRQLFVDELRNAIGLAERLGHGKLQKQLVARRNKLLNAHPELLTRFIEASVGHFGEHPITGKRDY